MNACIHAHRFTGASCARLTTPLR